MQDRRAANCFISFLCLLLVSSCCPTTVAPKSTRRLEQAARSDQHIEALGERAGLWGSLDSGFEGWAYPFKLFADLRISWRPDAKFEKRSFDLAEIATRQIVEPHRTRLESTLPDGARLDLTWLVPGDRTALVLLAETSEGGTGELALTFEPVLTPMHLEAAEELFHVSDDDTSRIREPERGAELIVATDRGGKARQDGRRVVLTLPLPSLAEGHDRRQVVVCFAAGWPDGPDVDREVVLTQRSLERESSVSRELFESLLDSRVPRVRSPDPRVDEAITWSAVSLRQLRVKNPDIGYGLVSGYSSSGQTTRPRYAWFFEEPMLTMRSLLRLGLEDLVRESFELLLRYQRDDGKTVHEVTQSLRWWPKFFEEFSYAYIHSDGAVYYLTAFGQYWRETGDLAFVESHWTRIERILAWCFSSVDESDGLLKINPGDWGSAESSFEVGKDTQLEAMWVAALRHCADLCDARSRSIAPDSPEAARIDSLARRCRDLEEKARASIESKLWSDDLSTYRWGLDRGGRPLDSLVPHHSLGVWFDVFDETRSLRMLETMATADFRTDWGVRSLSKADPRFDSSSYQSGSVWPVWNTGVIIGDFRLLRCLEGYRNWRAMVDLRRIGGVGPMPEALLASRCRRLPEGVPHQQFSECAVTNGFFDGVLGLRVDVPRRRLVLAPWLPPTWDRVRVDRVPFGDARVDIDLRRSALDWRLEARTDSHEPIELVFAPRLPAGSETGGVHLGESGELKISHEIAETPRAVVVTARVSLSSSQTTFLRVPFRRGVELFIDDPPLEIDQESGRLRLVRYGLEGNRYTLEVEGRRGRTYPLRFVTTRNPVRTRGVSRRGDRLDGFTAFISFPAGDDHEYVRRRVEIDLE